MASEKNSYGSPPYYTAPEKVGLYTLGILALFMLVGWGFCYFSFDGEKLIRPELNFAGLIIMLILPASAFLIFGLCRKISKQDIWPYCQEIWEKFFAHMLFAVPLAFYYSSNQGFMPAKAIAILVLAWIAASIGVYYFNQFLHQVCQAEDNKQQS